jgi:hypothetical protein
VDLSDTEWRRIVLSGTVTNPTVGIKIATSGDAVAMDYAQVEDGAFSTTPILTTTTTVTRAADVATINSAYFNNWFRPDQGTLFSKANVISGSAAASMLQIDDGSGGNRFAVFIYPNNTTNFASGIISAGNINLTNFTNATFLEKNISVLSYKSYFAFASTNGLYLISRSIATFPKVTIARIGSNSSSATTAYIERIGFIPMGYSDLPISNLSGGAT